MSAGVYDLIADRVWDGTSDSAVGGLAVRVRGQRIEAVVPVAELGADVERVEFPGCTVLPGLIDAHVHYSESMGPAFLAAGVTSVRDVGNDLSWILRQRQLNASDPVRGPSLVCCGFLLDGQGAFWQHIARHHGEVEALRESVREHVAAGVDQIKFYATLDGAMLAAGVDEARRLGKTTLAHLGVVDAAAAVRAGLDQIEHQTCCRPGWEETTAAERDELIELFCERGTVLDPTLVVWDRLGRVYDCSFRHDDRRAWVQPRLWNLWERLAKGYLGVPSRADYQAALPRLKRFLAGAHARGVTIALGTDTPFAWLWPGFSMHDELAMYVDAGLKPVDALRSATSVNARVIGRGEEVGRIAAGCVADLLVVAGDPLADITRIEAVREIIHQGVRLEPARLAELARTVGGLGTGDPMVQDLEAYVTFLERPPAAGNPEP